MDTETGDNSPSIYEDLTELYGYGACHVFALAMSIHLRDAPSVAVVVFDPDDIRRTETDNEHQAICHIGLALREKDALVVFDVFGAHEGLDAFKAHCKKLYDVDTSSIEIFDDPVDILSLCPADDSALADLNSPLTAVTWDDLRYGMADAFVIHPDIMVREIPAAMPSGDETVTPNTFRSFMARLDLAVEGPDGP